MSDYDVPFVPSAEGSVTTMVKLAELKRGEKVIDLGAGDGKLVMALARAGGLTTGVEIDPGRYRLARAKIRAEGLDGKARMCRGSFWEENLNPYDVIVLYGVGSIMERLERKIINECKDNCRIVSNRFTFPGWHADAEDNGVYRYRLTPARIQV
jgi:predicted RNA methylase